MSAKTKPATFVVVVEGGQGEIANIGERMAAAIAMDLREGGYLSDDQHVTVSPVRRANSKRKTPFPKEVVTPSEIM